MDIPLHRADDGVRPAAVPAVGGETRPAVEVQNLPEDDAGHDEIGDEVLAPLVAQTHQLHPQLEQVHNVQLAAPHLLELFRQLPGVLLVQLLNGFYKFFLH